MEQKLFDLMEKLYGEMQKGFTELKGDINGVKGDINDLKGGQSQIKKQVAQIENDLKPKVEAALDGYKLVYDKLEILEVKVDKLTEIVANHDVEIQVIRKAK